jgi:hypothetical protein
VIANIERGTWEGFSLNPNDYAAKKIILWSNAPAYFATFKLKSFVEFATEKGVFKITPLASIKCRGQA